MLQLFEEGFDVLSQNRTIILSVATFFFLLLGTKLEKKLSLSLFFFATLLLRLAYLQDIYLPPYFDSVEHFRIIKEIVEGWRDSTFWDSLPSIVPIYYHLGYHLLVSLLTLILGADIPNMMLVFGQVVLAFIPIPVFLLLWQRTKKIPPALFAALLAGFGWYMPAFAVNWGKYPALLGILFFEILLLHLQQKKKKNAFTKALLTLGIFTTAIIHTRVLILILIAYASWVFAKRLRNFPSHNQKSILRILLFSIFIYAFLSHQDPLLKLTLEPYLTKTSLFILVLSPFALKKYRRETYFSLFFILFLLVTLFIPTGGILPQFPNQTLLDRPFVEMTLFFPLALLSGFGLAGLQQALQDKPRTPPRLRRKLRVAVDIISLIIISYFGFYTFKSYDFYPSDCCDFVGYDDTLAFDWINKNLPPDAQIIIAGNPLNVIPNTTSSDLVASDAGIWITPLTGKEKVMLSYRLDFSSPEIHEQLCIKEIDYIYLGNTNQSFNHSKLDEKPEWYKKTLVLPSASIYQLITCSY